MFLNPKKFNAEIKKLETLKNSPDVLPVEDQRRIKQNVLRAISHPAPVASFSFSGKITGVAKYLVPALLGVSLIGGSAFAANNSKPGDILYPIKITTEKVQLALTVSEQSKAQLQAKFAQERLDELKELSVEAQSANGSSSVNISGSEDNHNFNFSTSTNGNLNLQIQSAGTNASITVISERGDGNNNNKINIQIKANQEAQLEVTSALDALSKVQKKLQAKGQTDAAAAIAQNIKNLQANAGLDNLFKSGNGEDNGKRNKSRENQTATSTIPAMPTMPTFPKIKFPNNFATSTTNIKINLPKNSGSFHIDVRQNSDTGDQQGSNNQTIITASSTSSSSIEIHQNLNSSSQSNFSQTFEH